MHKISFETICSISHITLPCCYFFLAICASYILNMHKMVCKICTHTSNLVDILQRQSKGSVCGSLWWQNSIESLKKSFTLGVSFFAFDFPSFEPFHVGWFFQHVIPMPTGDGNHRNCFRVVANLKKYNDNNKVIIVLLLILFRLLFCNH